MPKCFKIRVSCGCIGIREGCTSYFEAEPHVELLFHPMIYGTVVQMVQLHVVKLVSSQC